MYPDLKKIEQLHDNVPGGSMETASGVPSDSADDAGRRLIEATVASARALKGFIAEHDRVKKERDRFKAQMAGALDEVETLRNQVQEMKVQRDQFSNTLWTLTSQIEIATRKAQRLVGTHVSNRNGWFPALRSGTKTT